MTEFTDHAIPIDTVLPGDVITAHPDTGQPGEWTITHVRRVGRCEVLVRLDYTQPDGACGCLVSPQTTAVQVRHPRPACWLDGFSAREKETMLIWLSGYRPSAVARAVAAVTDLRDRRQDLRAKREVAS